MPALTFRPTATTGLQNLPDEDWTGTLDPTVDIEQYVRGVCHENGWSGAHVFAGAHGPVYDNETGYENNYHGWIDAR